jgi:hypothetical protein
VKHRLDLYKVTDLGATQLKNITDPTHVYSLEVSIPATTGPAPQSRTTRSAAKRRISQHWPAVAAALAVVLVAAGAYAWRAGFAPRFLGASVAEDTLANAPHLSIVVLPFDARRQDDRGHLGGSTRLCVRPLGQGRDIRRVA